MTKPVFRRFALLLSLLLSFALTPANSQIGLQKPTALETDSLATPLGIDSKQPNFSWKLQDARFGARQTAYEIQVASTRAGLGAGRADVWDSGRRESDASINVSYGGPALEPEKRYYWRVKVWDKDGKPYPTSDATWFETGLMDLVNWQAKWIGFEETEERRVREADAAWITNPGAADDHTPGDTHHDFRFNFDITKPIHHADLFVAGEDTPAAWVNGKQVLQAQPLPPWKHIAWKKYTRQDVTTAVQDGNNLLAVEIVHYGAPSDEQENHSRTPMNAVLYIESADGSIQLFKTGEKGWKGTLNAAGGWTGRQVDVAAWPEAVPYEAPNSDSGEAEQLGKPWQTGPVKVLRREFQITKPVTSARLYATALGAYEFHLNGQRVGDQILAPGWMDFREKVAYQVYDVTSQLKRGSNTIGALLAPGWYTTPLQWLGQGYNYGDTPPALRAQLRIEHPDGTTEWVVTDNSWKADVSPMLFAEIYDGESYDARRVQSGWDTAQFSDAKWKPVEMVQPKEPEIVAQYFQPIRVEKILTAKSITSPKSGVYIYDFGQNLAGVPRVRVSGPAGTDIQMRFAEVLNPDGTMYVDNLRTAKATDHFVLSGKGIEEYQPTFTFHGFRYAEITGLPTKPDAETLKVAVIHTAAPFTAELKTGSPMINQLWSNILWGQRSNFVGVPTDCPQRDERLGWAADAQVFWRAASYNMDLTTFSEKFAGDLRGTQVGTPMYGIFAPGTETPNPGHGTGWSDAGVIIPWTSWIQTGNTRIIEQNWDGMEKYLAAIESQNPDHLWKKDYGIPFGDWLAPEGPSPEDLIATAYWAYDVELMRRMAHAAGKESAEQKYAALFGEIKVAFQKAYVRADGFVGAVQPPSPFGPDAGGPMSKEPMDTQTTYVLALHMNLLPEAMRPLAAKRLVDLIAANGWRLGTGFLGTPYLLESLADTGYADVAYRLLLNTEYPSWGYLVDKGATTMWERWNGDKMRDDPSMNSYNHYAYGAVADWIYRYAAGIDTIESDAGFHTILLRPNFDARLGSLNFSYDSPYGTVRSDWTVKGGSTIWKITIPPNAHARLPISRQKAAAFKLDGQPLDHNSKLKAATEGSQLVYDLPAGTYSFEVSLAGLLPSAKPGT
jgi:alpha-L-rhamnosidase